MGRGAVWLNFSREASTGSIGNWCWNECKVEMREPKTLLMKPWLNVVFHLLLISTNHDDLLPGRRVQL
jgi:hypothetical protein